MNFHSFYNDNEIIKVKVYNGEDFVGFNKNLRGTVLNLSTGCGSGLIPGGRGIFNQSMRSVHIQHH